MPDQEEERTHHRSGDIQPLIRRPKPTSQPPKSSEPTDREIYEAHKLSQAAAVETPEELAQRLSRLHEGLQGLDDDGDLPPAC